MLSMETNWRQIAKTWAVEAIGGVTMNSLPHPSTDPGPCSASDLRATGTDFDTWTSHTFVSQSADSRKAVVSFWHNCVHLVMVNRLGSLCLPRKRVVRSTAHPNMTVAVYCGRKSTKQQPRTHIQR